MTIGMKLLAVSAAFLGCCSIGWPGQPPRFNYQAKLKNSMAIPLSGTHAFTFWIYEGGTAETADSGIEMYKESASVAISDGIVNHAVGTGIPIGPALLSSVFRTGSDLYLQVAVDSESNVVLPRTRLDPVPFAISSGDGDARIIVNADNTPGDATNTFIISQPGSYYLTDNITGASAKHGISIQANDVTLDLNGFALIAGGGGAFRGVDVPNAQNNLYIRNGSVRGWTDGGVRTDASSSTLAENLRLADNVGAQGLVLGSGGSAWNCTANGNGTGFVLGNGAQITGCSASGNVTGFFGSDRSQLINCISSGNTQNGFDCTSYVTIMDCTANRNFGTHGIAVQGGSTVIRCNSSRNIPFADGIHAGTDCTVADCTAGSNANAGISGDAGTIIRGCTAQSNGQDGIDLSSNCQALGNTCDQNNTANNSTNAGLYTSGSGSRIEANSCTSNGNGNGFYIVGSGNLIIRNSAHGNGRSNFDIFANNDYAAVVSLTAVSSPAVDGNSAPASFGTEVTWSSWANFAY